MKASSSRNPHRFLLPAVLLLLGVLLPGCKVAKGTSDAEAEVAEFHARWNEDHWKLIYDDAHLSLQKSETEAEVVALLAAMKKTYGAMKSTSKEGTGFNHEDGVTDINLTYRTVYERGEGTEKFVFRLEGDEPQLLSWEVAQAEPSVAEERAEEVAREAKPEVEEPVNAEDPAPGAPNGG